MLIKQTSFFLLIALVSMAQACGPWLPEAYVLRNDDVFYAPPIVGFGAELEHLLPESVPHEAALESDGAGGESSLQELRTALANKSTAEDEALAIVQAYKAFRQQLNSIKPYLERSPFAYYDPGVDEDLRSAKLQLLQSLRVPKALPDEFRHYLAGALAYYRKDHDAALKSWQAVLDLPKVERHYRSVMAAYMIAKACPQSALEYYPFVRRLVEIGYADSQGLAAASYGKEGRARLDHGQHQLAIDLYLKQWSSGYRNAVGGLQFVAADVWSHSYDDDIIDLAKSESGRAVLTAYLLTMGDSVRASEKRTRFLNVLPDVDTMDVDEAGRFALMEYQRNNLTSARLWLSYAAPEDALALWVKSKLFLRAGKIEEGRTLMMALTEEMAANKDKGWRLDTTRAWGELGLLMLREQRYVEAADAFWNARSWQDCAYVLERLLTTDELLAWVVAHPLDPEDGISYYDGDPKAVLARRLMREARFDQALEYFDVNVKQHAEDYMEAMRQASDSAKDAQARAQHYWAAARQMRDYGMLLFGTELSPDYAWMGGSFEWANIPYQRRQMIYTSDHRINEPRGEEFELARKTQALPDRRFHYRYRALSLAELAAGLLPNNHEQAARIYCVAGSWVKFRDPASADRLFKQLVVRCPETELGRAAAKMNWFPQVDLESIEPFADGI